MKYTVWEVDYIRREGEPDDIEIRPIFFDGATRAAALKAAKAENNRRGFETVVYRHRKGQFKYRARQIVAQFEGRS